MSVLGSAGSTLYMEDDGNRDIYIYLRVCPQKARHGPSRGQPFAVRSGFGDPGDLRICEKEHWPVVFQRWTSEES